MKRLPLAAAVLLAAAAPDPVVAVRGNDQITASQVRALIANADPQTRVKLTTDPAALQTVIRNALLQRGVLEEARAANWDRKPEIAALLARTRDTAIAQSFLASHATIPAGYPSEVELQAAYEQARPQLMQPRGYHLLQLFVALPAGSPAADSDRAKAALNPLRDSFAAGHTGKLPPGVSQLDLGWVTENHLQPEAKTIVAGLPEGQVSPPVCTQMGCAVLKLAATRPAGPAPLPEVREGLIKLLRQQKQREAEQAYANTLLARAPVRVDEIQLSHLTGQ